MSEISIQTPELLHIDDHGSVCFGADQEWYSTVWQRRAGCGPTACSHLLWYLSQTRQTCGSLCPYDGTRRNGFLRLMEAVWQFVTPGRMGVNSTKIFQDGAAAYGNSVGVPLRCDVLDIPTLPMHRPSEPELLHFLARAFAQDLPVAFLNLSNGSLHNLDNWHWVTLVSLNRESGVAVMYDQRRRSKIDLSVWLRTTSLGGGFVTVQHDASASLSL